jgi:hypothetical protein
MKLPAAQALKAVAIDPTPVAAIPLHNTCRAPLYDLAEM